MNKKMNRPQGLCAIFNKKIKQLRTCISIVMLLVFLNPFASNASHVVGGEISYRCLGGSTFEVSLTVYRDCFLGSTDFDPIASIGIFDSNNELVTSLNGLDSGQLLIPATIPDTLEVLLSDPCLFAPINICVSSMTYVDTVILPPISGGYQLVYQRCCRNSSISNIINSSDIGASFVVDISEMALINCNSSPQFSVLPPVFLCVNEPFVFDQSLVDVDGDSLAYSFCTPFEGASILNPRPQPPLPPPYNEINWQDPPYNLDNLLGGVPLEIDPVTGVISGEPSTQGLFLVGLCIEEYRNGQLISTSRREFQYTVGFCSSLVADFDAPSIQCEDFEVDFINTSINATEFLWEFNDPGNPGATSTEVNPTYTFSGLGTYNVMLIADPNGDCSDTTYADVTIDVNTITPNFVYTALSCTDSVELILIDVSSDSEYDIVSWFWELSDGQTATEQIPVFVIEESQNLLVTLTVTNSNGCQASILNLVPVNLIPSTLLETERTICQGDTVQLNPMPPLGLPYKYSWSPADGLSDPDIASPLAFPESDVTYILMIQDTITDCIAELNTTINVLDNPELTISVGNILCGSETELTASTNISGDFLWATDIDFNNVISDSASVTVSSFGENTYYVQFISQNICESIDSVTVIEQSINVSIDPLEQIVCVGDVATFTATNEDPNDSLTYTWFNIDNLGVILSTDSILNFTTTEAGEQLIYFQAENQFGCTYLDSVVVISLDQNLVLEIEAIENCNDLSVSFSNLSPHPEYYQWVFNLPSGNDTLFGGNINVSFPSAGNYNYSLEPIEGLPCEMPSQNYEITVGEGSVTADFEWIYLECENDLSIQFLDLSTAVQGNVNSWSWTFDGGIPPTMEQNPILDLSTAQTVIVELIVTTDEGCADTLSQSIEFALTNIGTFENEAVICDGNSVQLNPLGNPTLTYEWEPAQFLDDSTSVSPIASPPTSTIFSVSITDPENNNCLIEKTVNVIVPEDTVEANFGYEIVSCESDSIIILFSDTSTPSTSINNWFWSFSDGSTSNDQNVELKIETGTELIVQLQVQTIEGCSDIFSDTIQVETLDFNLLQNEIIKCNIDPVNLNPGGNSSLTYSWTPTGTLDNSSSPNPSANPNETTEYCVTVSNGFCTTEECVTVIVPDEFVEAAFEYETINCDNSTVTLSFTDNSTPSSDLTNWFWNFSNGTTSNDQNTELEVSTGTELIVQFQVQTAEGCTDIISDTIQVETFEFNLPQSEILKCTGVPVNLNPGGNPDYTYSWSPAGTLNNSESPNPIANPIETTEYCVTVTNGNCSQESCVTVVVPEVPLMADFSYSVSDCINEAVISFEDQTQNSFGDIVSWFWTFSNGTTSDLENPVLTIDESTTLTVNLEVVTSEGCEADFTQEIEINLIDIDIPSQVILCEGVPVQLNTGGNPNHSYLWMPSAGLTNDDIPDPFAFPLSTTTYTVIVSDGVCEVIQSVQVVVPEVPLNADFSFSINDCTDEAEISFTDESQYSPGGIVEWNWQFSNGDSSDLQNPILILNESQILDVTLEVTTNDGCTAITIQEIIVNIIDVNIPDSIINCNEIGVELNPGGDPNINYDWSPSNGLDNSNSFNPTANPSVTTTYTVTVSDGPCEIIRSVEVIVPDEPLDVGFTFNFDDCTDNAIIEFTDTTIFSNNTITDWDWTFFGNSTQTSDLQNPIITLNQSDTILAELTVTTADGCTATASQEIEVNLIDINISGSVIYCTSQGVTLNPDGNTDYEYSWAPSNGLSATDVASPTVTGLTETTTYSVTVTFGNCTLTRSIEILIPDDPLVAAFETEYLTCIDSSTIQFNDASSFSGNIIDWNWLVNSEVSDQQNPVFVFYENQAVNVQLVVTTAHGCTDTIISSFDISIMDDVNLVDIATCNSNGEFLNPNSNPNYSYYWTPATGLSGDTLSANPFAIPDSTTTYTVEITNIGIGCVEERTVTYTIPTEPLIAGFEWELLNCSDSATVAFTDTSSYSEVITDWTWTFDNGLSDTLQNPTFIFQNSDTVDVQLIVTSIDGCVDSIETTVEIDVINISAMQDTFQLCQEDSVYLNPNGNPDLFYTWSPSSTLDSANFYNPLAKPLETTKYFVTITSPNNIACNEVRIIDVLVPTQPIDLDWNYPTDTVICTPTLELIAESNSAVDFLWSNQPDFQSQLGFDSNFVAFPNNSDMFYIQVSDDAGCSMTDSILVTSYSILAELEEDITLCYGDSVELEVLLNPLTPSIDLQYTWTPQNGIILNPTTSTPLLSPEDSTEYTLLIENQFGCEYHDTIQINVVDLEMLVDIFPRQDSIEAGESIQLSATESADWNYLWTPSGSLDVDNIFNPIATPEETTTYNISIEDLENGCHYQDSVSIFVFDESRCQEPYVFIPKGFTPNDDGLNDVLFVRGNYIEEMEFVIFNRWGEKVFETKDQSQGWDGRVNGKKVSPDVFGYFVKLKCFGGEEYLMKGNVTLIR